MFGDYRATSWEPATLVIVIQTFPPWKGQDKTVFAAHRIETT